MGVSRHVVLGLVRDPWVEAERLAVGGQRHVAVAAARTAVRGGQGELLGRQDPRGGRRQPPGVPRGPGPDPPPLPPPARPPEPRPGARPPLPPREGPRAPDAS